MANGIVRVPEPVNEPVRSYGPGSPEKQSLKQKLDEMLAEQIEIPVIIGQPPSGKPGARSQAALALSHP